MDLTKWNGLAREDHGGQSKVCCEALLVQSAFRGISSETWKAYHLASSDFPNIPWQCMPRWQAEENSCQRKYENAQVLRSALPGMSSGGNMTQGQWSERLGWCKWDRGSSLLGKGAGLGHLTFFLVFRCDMCNKPLIYFTHLLHMQMVLPFEKKISFDILNQRTNFMAVGGDEICFIKWLTLDTLIFSTLSAQRFTESSRVLVSSDSRECTGRARTVSTRMRGETGGFLSKRKAMKVKKVRRYSLPRSEGRKRNVLEM